MDNVMIIGLIAAVLTTGALFPQFSEFGRQNQPKISTGMFALTSAGVLVWFIYGMFVNNFPIIIVNSLAFIQAIAILFFKIKYK